MLNDRESNVCYSSADAKLKFVCNSVGPKTTTTQQNKKGYGKLATTRQGSKHCTKCDRPGHLQEDCWGSCKYCKKNNHPSDRCFNKPKDDSNAEKANKTKKKPNKKKKKAKKAAIPALVD